MTGLVARRLADTHIAADVELARGHGWREGPCWRVQVKVRDHSFELVDTSLLFFEFVLKLIIVVPGLIALMQEFLAVLAEALRLLPPKARLLLCM